MDAELEQIYKHHLQYLQMQAAYFGILTPFYVHAEIEKIEGLLKKIFKKVRNQD
jgi:hypothetical protein